ncbi:hypothetical protein QA802_13300 [Streptomyces sp. B21-105]|uniref:hypothetical protein n=1 Tax=Streptomyces sp. B21-105 TaxID=3039417 RepID=UPI002FF0297A
MSHTSDEHAHQSVSRPDCPTRREWAGPALAVLGGVVEGCDRAELEGPGASDPRIAALQGLLARLEELMAQGGASGG